jgi:ERO1-like protein beta
VQIIGIHANTDKHSAVSLTTFPTPWTMMSTTTRAFYLAIFALFNGACAAQQASAASSYSSPDVCAVSVPCRTDLINELNLTVSQFEPKARVSDACASYADLDTLNDRVHPYVRNLAKNTDFFAYYRLNLFNQQCQFFGSDEGLCGNIACSVTTLDNEEDIPDVWKVRELSRLEGPKAQHPPRKQQELKRPLQGELGESVGESCVVEYDDECDERDYCVPEDESASAKGDYVSLNENPERYTGYSGEGAHKIWETIYRENCFSKPTEPQSVSAPGLSPLQSFSQNQAQAAMDFKQVMKAHGREQAQPSIDFEDECLEKRVFYRVISGMHASISTHLCYDYLNQTTGTWGPNLQCYKERLHNHPERISNLYFNYAFVLRAVGKLRDYVQEYTFCTGDPEQDALTKRMITTLADVVPEGPKIFDESIMFQDNTLGGLELKEDFRNRFRNVSRIMDCVGCDKCRLWGKLQTNGFGTALKVLFEFGNGNTGDAKPLLRRTELVALINTLDKISSALKALEYFRDAVTAEANSVVIKPIFKESTQPPPKPIAADQATPQASDELDELDDFEDLETDAFATKVEKTPPREISIVEAFREELTVVWGALKFVLRSYIVFPKRAGELFLAEAWRLYALWIGKPVPERAWEWKPPAHDEI